MDEGEDQASNMGFHGRGTEPEKFYWRSVAPTIGPVRIFVSDASGMLFAK